MLPAFPKIEKLCGDASRRLIDRLVTERAPLLGLIDKHIQFEGRQSTIHRHDDTVGYTPLLPVTAEVRFYRVPLQNLADELLTRINELAEQIAKGSELDRAISEVGNVVDAGGQPLSDEFILKLLDKMDHSFEPDGTWNPPTMVASPEMVERLMKLAKSDGSSSAEFNESLATILDRKRDDFRRREADRVLAG